MLVQPENIGMHQQLYYIAILLTFILGHVGILLKQYATVKKIIYNTAERKQIFDAVL